MNEPETNAVPCNGCIRCCLGDMVRLLPGEDQSQYKTEPHPLMTGEVMLAHKENEQCIYLSDGGCEIHDHKPQQCRSMDCRVLAKRIPYTLARKLNNEHKLRIAVWKKGKELSKKEINK